MTGPSVSGAAELLPRISLLTDRDLRRRVIWITLALWAANFLITTAASAISGYPDFLLRAGVRLAVDLFGLLLCAALLVLIETGPANLSRRRVAATIPLTLGAAAINLAANDLALRWIGLGVPFTRANLAINLYYLGYWFWFFMGWAALYLTTVYSAEVRNHAAARAAVQISAQQAQLRALQYQINPHFLFNTLNSLSALVLDRRTDDSEAMIGRLSSFLRTTLDEGAGDDVELGVELEHQRLYLEIERVRFPELQFEVDVPPGLVRARVPGLILQPLVENAVKHGPAGAGRRTCVKVQAGADGPWLHLTVVNDSVADERPRGMGLGLSNVRERLRLRFGDAFSMTSGPHSAGRYEVRLSLPLRLAE